jgi:hypothetical protein
LNCPANKLSIAGCLCGDEEMTSPAWPASAIRAKNKAPNRKAATLAISDLYTFYEKTHHHLVSPVGDKKITGIKKNSKGQMAEFLSPWHST